MRPGRLLRDVRLETRVSVAVDEAILRWQGAERSWEAVEYVLTHDPTIGKALSESGKLRSFVYHGAKSVCMPDIAVIYEIPDDRVIIVHDAEFKDSRFPFQGTA